MIAFIGTGLLGSGFARAALRRGESVHVYNRTLDKAAPLVKDGAKVFPLLADAVRGVTHVHLVLADDASVDAVLKDLLPALAKDTIIVDHTTTSIAGAKTRTVHLQALGIFYQHAPVFMSPANALAASGVMLVSGDEARYNILEAHLRPMTGKLVYFGSDTGRAAAMKLSGNLMLMAITAGIADAAAFLKSADISRTELTKLFAEFNPGMSLQPRTERMLAGDFQHPSWELQMARKDARLILTEKSDNESLLKFIPHIAAQMDVWLERGHAHADWTIIGKEGF
ncbi:MAG: NAD(P)-dependent oxidoreductase [Spirochaetes bacterium]|nr:NAD(P)-dependent oxidoreductase [Spirochaetota bacterium]